MKERPDCISKLAMYLESKEPLIYLFIINSDFIEDDGTILGPGLAGVKYENRRVKFLYNQTIFDKLTPEELYFLVIHEAFHIFKKHILRHHTKDYVNHLLLNIAEDAVINFEICDLTFNYDLRPKMIDGTVSIPQNFTEEFRDLGKDAMVTERVYHWYMNRKMKKEDLLYPGARVKIKSTGEYGNISKDLGKGSYEVKKDDGSKSNHHKDDLVPVVKVSNSPNGIPFNPDGFEVEFEMQGDKHFNSEEEDGVEEKLFTQKLAKQAREISKSAGTENSSGMLSKVEALLKPKINWKKELNRRMNIFMSNNSFLKKRVLSPINYPWNPRSNYDILSSYWITMTQKIQTYIIFAIDTSGSVFYDNFDIENFFTEIDSAAKELEFSRSGSILTIQWDTSISENLKPYRQGDWKKYQLKGGGGTTPKVVFKHLDDIFEDKGGYYMVNANGTKFATRNKTDLPFLVFLTDGEFFRPLKEDDLGIYKNSKKNILYFTKNAELIYPRENYVLYS